MITHVLIAAAPGVPEGDAEEICASLERARPAVPVLPVRRASRVDAPCVSISAAGWARPEADLWALDARVDAAARAGAFALCIEMDGQAGALAVATEILTRYQRFARRANEASMTARFERTLDRHRALYDLGKPLVKADYDHAIDTWQWLLRLEPSAGAAVQLAALFHDIERLVTEADVRVEHRAADYQAFKDAHAAAGARMTQAMLREIGWDDGTSARVAAMIAHHERTSGDPELALLNDADSLSFFSLNSMGFLNYFGLEHSERKIAFTLRRMRPAARRRLRPVRYTPEVDRLLREALARVDFAEGMTDLELQRP